MMNLLKAFRMYFKLILVYQTSQQFKQLIKNIKREIDISSIPVDKNCKELDDKWILTLGKDVNSCILSNDLYRNHNIIGIKKCKLTFSKGFYELRTHTP